MIIGTTTLTTSDLSALVAMQARSGLRDRLNEIGESVIVTDLDGVVRFWNTSAQRIYGWAANDAVGREIMDLTPSPHALDNAAAIMERLRAGATWSGHFPVRRKDGSEFTAFVTNSAIRSDDQIVGIIGVSREASLQDPSA